jgi:hypothetical protein
MLTVRRLGFDDLESNPAFIGHSLRRDAVDHWKGGAQRIMPLNNRLKRGAKRIQVHRTRDTHDKWHRESRLARLQQFGCVDLVLAE